MLPNNLSLNTEKTAGCNNGILIHNIDMKIGSNRYINKAEVYHKKSSIFRSLVTPTEAYATPEVHSIKSWDRSIINIFNHGHFWSKELGYLTTFFGKMKMAGILMTIFCGGINAVAFGRTNYAFSKSGHSDAQVERKWHNLADGELQKAKDKWNEDRNWWSNGWVLSSISKTNKTLTSWTSNMRFYHTSGRKKGM